MQGFGQKNALFSTFFPIRPIRPMSLKRPIFTPFHSRKSLFHTLFQRKSSKNRNFPQTDCCFYAKNVVPLHRLLRTKGMMYEIKRLLALSSGFLEFHDFSRTQSEQSNDRWLDRFYVPCAGQNVPVCACVCV